MSFLVTLAALALLLVSLAPYAPVSVIWTDLPSHFALQAMIGAILLMLAALVFRCDGRVFLMIFAAFYLALFQIRSMALEKPATATGRPLKILQANVLMLNQETKDFERLVRAENPDIIAAMEVNDAFRVMLQSLKDIYPHQRIEPQNRGSFGLAVLSKQPLENFRQEFFVHDYIASFFFTLTHEGKNIRLAAIHPANPVKDFPARDRELAAIAQKLGAEKTPLIVIGDFNATPYAPAFKKFLHETGLYNTRHGKGLHGTFPAWAPFSFLRIPIDHILATSDFSVRELRAGPAINSDHLPLLAVLSLK